MKKTGMIWLPFLCIIAVAQGSDPNNADIETAFKGYLENNGVSRISGKGIYVHTLYKKAVNVGYFLKGMEFKDEEQKKAYIKNLQIYSGLDFSLTEDKHNYAVEKYCYDNNKVRQETSKIDAEKTSQIKDGRLSPDGLEYQTTAFDGTKTIYLYDDPIAKPTVINTVKIPVPGFKGFGITDSNTDIREIYLKGMATGIFKLNGYRDNEGVHITVKMPAVEMMGEFILDPLKNMMRNSKLYRNDKLIGENIASDYVKSDSGEWYPQRYTIKKYVDIDGQNVLTYLEEYEALPGTVDFNIPIEPSVFSPKIPDGRVIDITSGKQKLLEYKAGVSVDSADKK
jgi:hypothetical protein